jgi:hypothetical protein
MNWHCEKSLVPGMARMSRTGLPSTVATSADLITVQAGFALPPDGALAAGIRSRS